MNRRSLFALAAAGSRGLAAGSDAAAQTGAGRVVVKSAPGMGRGVFATRTIRAGTVVFTDHALLLSAQDRKAGSQTILQHYYFEDDDGTALLALGMGSLVNHSSKAPNVTHEWDSDGDGHTIAFTALRTIRAGEQLFFDYDFDPDKIPDWADNPR